MKIVIDGAGEVGCHLAKMLAGENNEITIIDQDAEQLRKVAQSCDVITCLGNPSSIDTLKEAGVAKCDLFIAVNPSDSQDVNIVSAVLAKKLGAQRTTARINNQEYLSFEYKNIFTELGIDLLFYPEKIAATEITDMLRRTTSTDSLDFARGKLQMAVFRLEEESNLVDRQLGEVVAEISTEDIQFRVVAIARDNETLIPRVDTRFRCNDLVFIISKREGINVLMDYVGKRSVEVKKLMILGGSPIGEMVATAMCKDLEEVKIIDSNRAKCEALSESLPRNVTVVYGDGRSTDFLIEEGIKDFDAFVAVTPDTETNILSCVAAKKLGMSRTIAQIENIEYIRIAEGMGVDAAINKKLITAGRIFKFTLNNKVRLVKYMSGTDAEVIEFIVAPDSKITKGKIKDIGFPEKAIIGGVIRGSDAFIAIGDTEIKAYDRVAVFALPEVIKEVDKFFK
ncbi:MAG: Trk system potassium transporter TrkA [Bacteroidales bacterium]|nr:Trk system potassium transporter TrkA [Bacteroidales bacterium]